MTNAAGNLIGDLTVACLPAAPGRVEGLAGTVVGGATGNVRHGERFVVFGSGVAERYYERWFDAHLPSGGSVSYRTLGAELCGLAIAGPASRTLLEEVTDADVSAHGMRFMAFAEMDAGLAPVWCGRISFTGGPGLRAVDAGPLPALRVRPAAGGGGPRTGWSCSDCTR